MTVEDSLDMLNAAAGIPLYEQLKQSLVADILKGVYPYGKRVPSETELAEIYKVSRITVRRAFADLIANGYLTSQQGIGTFVRFKKDVIQCRTFDGFTESSEEEVRDRQSMVLSKEIIAADELLAQKLQVPPEEKILCVHRLMLLHNRPIMIDLAYFPHQMYPGLASLIQDNVSTFALLRNTYNKTFARADKTVGAERAGTEEAEHLNCLPGDPLLWVTKVIYDSKDTPIHYSSYYILADSCIFTLSVENS